MFKIQLVPELSSLEISMSLSLLLELVVDKSLIDQRELLTEDVITGWMATVIGVPRQSRMPLRLLMVSLVGQRLSRMPCTIEDPCA